MKMWHWIKNIIFIAKDKIELKVEYFNVIEEAYYMLKCSVICGNVMMVSVNI